MQGKDISMDMANHTNTFMLALGSRMYLIRMVCHPIPYLGSRAEHCCCNDSTVTWEALHSIDGMRVVSIAFAAGPDKLACEPAGSTCWQ
jgi:hypothetical protein